MKNFNYLNLTPFQWFVVNNFPFIEEDFDAITNYQLLCKVVEYLNKVIDKTNETGKGLEELSNQFINLKNYVDKYFDDLDLQTEINRKLDEMAESGQLADIVTAYLQLRCIYGFDTISEMRLADNLVNGSFMRTLGQNSTYDGLGAFYKARNIKNTDVIDNINIVALSNPNLVAEKIKDTRYNELRNETDIINSNDTILMGDSYGQGYTVIDGSAQYVDGWTAHVKRILKLNDNNCFIFNEGGIGFADPGQGGHSGFLDLLQDNINTIQDRDKIKNIIVCAGHNDTNKSFSEIDVAISNFITYCKTQFPNAKIYIGMIANDGRTNSTGINKRLAIKNTVLIAYQHASRTYDSIYLNGVENVMKYYANFSEDGYHPTAQGYKNIAENICQAFKNGYTQFFLPMENIIFDDPSNINFGSVRIGSQLLGNLTQFRVISGTMTFNTPISSNAGYIVLGNVTCNNFKFTEYGTLEIPLYIGITTSDNKFYGGFGYMSINNQNQIILAFRHFKNDGTNISNFTNIKNIFLDTGYATVSTYNC